MRDHFYWELHEGASIQAVRFGEWKAVRNGPKANVELYNIKNDLAERKNVADENPTVVEKALQFMQHAHVDDPYWPMRNKKGPRPALDFLQTKANPETK